MNNDTAAALTEPAATMNRVEVEIPLDPMEQEALRLQQEWEQCAHDNFKAAPQSKYDRYDVPVDHYEGDRATEIRLFSTANRPGSRRRCVPTRADGVGRASSTCRRRG